MAWIIKDNGKKYKVECPFCKSIIGFRERNEINEVDLEHLIDYCDIKCPACGKRIDLKVNGKRVRQIETLD